MKRNLETIENVRKRLEDIKGQDVKLQVNRGRKKIVSFDAKLVAIYPSVFTVTVDAPNITERSYSYTEILCGNVKVSPKTI